MRIQLLMTGNEIMSGDTVDSNSALIARRLGELDLTVTRKLTLGDDRQALEAELSQMTADADLVIVNGGLGPTVDDLTAEVVAAVAGVEVEQHPEALAHLETWCGKRKLPLNEANLKQALLPAGCEILDNATGSAVGFQIAVGDCRVICTPGVPGELRLMMDIIAEQLTNRLDQPIATQVLRLQTFGLGESNAQQLIADNIPDWPEEVELGFRAGAPQMEIKLTTRSKQALTARNDCLLRLKELIGDHIIGEGDTRLAESVLYLLRERGQTLTVAESCTGGLIASMLTKIPGSSEAFEAGFVTYSNRIKQELLGVSADTLTTEGAVSEAVVLEMARGALARTEADYAIAVSGIAGPGGGSEDKPVGTVWIAWGSRDLLRTRRLRWPFDRAMVQTMSAAGALDMVRRMLLGIESDPRYFVQRRA